MKLAVLMDPLFKLNPSKDSSLSIIQSALQLGWSVSLFTANDIICRDDQAFSQVFSVDIRGELDRLSEYTQWFGSNEQLANQPDGVIIECMGIKPLAEFDIILMRKDPPFDLSYITATYALDLAEKAHVLVANKPQSLRDVNEKFFTLRFPQCCPASLVSSNVVYLREFWQQHRSVIFKPLDSMGGDSIFHVEEDGRNLSVILELLTKRGQVNIMAQTYIPEITMRGDKRILLIHGEPVAYALARIPAPGELRGNLAAGARGEVVPLTERDRWICSEIGPTLKEKGLYFVGIDVIGDYLTEINVTSPTCVREITKETGLDIAGDYLRCLAFNRV